MAEEWEDLLDTPAEKAIKPPPIPKGTYKAFVKDQKAIKSREKQTPGIEFTFSALEPQPDVDSVQWKEYLEHPAIGGIKPEPNHTFWLSQKSLYRLKEFCEKCGAKPDGSMKKMVADSVSSVILLTVKQKVASDGETVFSEIDSFAAAS